MSKYINADELKGIIQGIMYHSEKSTITREAVEGIIDNVCPSADVIPSDEIVRCKNCIHARHNETFPEKYECRFSSTLRKKDDFCSEGETEEDFK